MTQSLSGQFLISAKQLRDPNFFRSVVLIVEHGEKGAMGLIINRPSDITIRAALQEHFELPESEEKVYIGGPVEPEALFIIHNARELDVAETPVIPGVYVGSSAETFEEVVRGAIDGKVGLKFRILAGCAGWGGGQLEGELARGDWLVTPATIDSIFHDDPYAIWDSVLKGVSLPPHIARGLQGNPELN